MKNIVTKVSMIFICLTQMCLMPASVFLQETIEQIKPDNLPDNCVKVKLTTNSDSLKENAPMSVITTIYNKCGKKIEFLYRPSFILDKSERQPEVRTRFGQTRLGVIFRDGAFEPFNTKYYINEGKELEFVSDTSEIIWKDLFSSQEAFAETFDGLETGEYYLQAEIDLVLSGKGKKIITKRVYSNKVEVSYKAGN